MNVQKATDNDVLMRNMEDLAQRVANLEMRVTRQEGELKGLKGKVEELERR